MNEVWERVDGYYCVYEVSNLGRVRRCKTNRILSQSRVPDGYSAVCLSMNGHSEFALVHRLVAYAFVPNPDGLPYVSHKDGDPSNNRADNLVWVSAKTRSAKPIRYMKTGVVYPTIGEASRATGVKQKAIRDICNVKGFFKENPLFIWEK